MRRKTSGFCPDGARCAPGSGCGAPSGGTERSINIFAAPVVTTGSGRPGERGKFRFAAAAARRSFSKKPDPAKIFVFESHKKKMLGNWCVPVSRHFCVREEKAHRPTCGGIFYGELSVRSVLFVRKMV